MLFKRQKCEKCGQQYDAVEKDCPVCNTPNKAYRKGISKGVSWTPWWHQLILIAIEFLFMELISMLIAKLILKVNPNITAINYMMLGNSLIYLTMFIAFIGVTIPFRKKIYKIANYFNFYIHK